MSTACSTFPGMPLSSEISTSTLRGAGCVRGESRVRRQGEGRRVTPRRGGRVRMRNRGRFLRHAGAHRVSRRARAPELVALLAAARQSLIHGLEHDGTEARRAPPRATRSSHAGSLPPRPRDEELCRWCRFATGAVGGDTSQTCADDGAFFSQRREVKNNPTASSTARLPFHLRSPLPRPSLP